MKIFYGIPFDFTILGGATQFRKIGYFEPVRFESLKNYRHPD